MSQHPESQDKAVTVDIDELRKERKNANKEVTKWSNEIEKTIQVRGSRRYVNTLLKKITTANDRAKAITDLVAEGLTDAECEAEYNRQLEYTAKAEDARELAIKYFEERKDDAPSETASIAGDATTQPTREKGKEAAEEEVEVIRLVKETATGQALQNSSIEEWRRCSTIAH